MTQLRYADAFVVDAIEAARQREQDARERTQRERAIRQAVPTKPPRHDVGHRKPRRPSGEPAPVFDMAPTQAHASWGLSAQLANIYAVLMRGPWDGPAHIAEALHGHPASGQEVENLYTQLTQLRKRLARCNICIPYFDRQRRVFAKPFVVKS